MGYLLTQRLCNNVLTPLLNVSPKFENSAGLTRFGLSHWNRSNLLMAKVSSWRMSPHYTFREGLCAKREKHEIRVLRQEKNKCTGIE